MPEETATITFVITPEKFLVTADLSDAGVSSKTWDLAKTELAPPLAQAIAMLMLGLKIGVAPVVEVAA